MRSGDRLRHVLCGLRGRLRLAYPLRHRARERGDVGGQRCVRFAMPGRLIADEVDDGRPRTPRVVEIGDGIREAGTEMEERQRRPSAHAGIAVGGPAANPFEEPEHGADRRNSVERLHQSHFRRAGVGEADLEASCRCRPEQRLRTRHRPTWTSRICLHRG